MSRIHEALKKAATERNARLGVAPTSELAELTGETLVQDVSFEQIAGEGQKKLVDLDSTGSLGYDEILKKCHRTEWKIDPRYSVFVNEANDRSGAERFRTLRSKLYQIAATRPLKRILVTSSVPAEGKTFIASNLAQSIIRQENRKVLLIDGDLRASRLHLTLGASETPGLSDYLRGDADEFKVIQAGKESNLCFIAGGTEVANPSELLHSEAMQTLLDRLTPLFDWVIIDAPPAIAVHDASILADMCDGVLFIVRAGETDFELAQKASGEFAEKNLLGVILNRVEKVEGYPYYYAYSKDRKES
jgi:protein-tyrosine kinase